MADVYDDTGKTIAIATIFAWLRRWTKTKYFIKFTSNQKSPALLVGLF